MGQSASKRPKRKNDLADLNELKAKIECLLTPKVKELLAPNVPGAEEDHLDEMDECPVCLLYFASLNTTTCCSSCICTECYGQVSTSKAAAVSNNACPFCSRGAYTITYRGCKSAAQRQAERSQKIKVEEALYQARLNEEFESQTRRQRRLAADPNAPVVHDEGSIAHEWALAQEAQEAFAAERAGQYRTILEQHAEEGHTDPSLEADELMLMQAMLLSMEGQGQPEAEYENLSDFPEAVYEDLADFHDGASDGTAGGTAGQGGHPDDKAAAHDRRDSGSSTHTEVHYHDCASQQPCQPVSKDGSQMVTQGRLVTATVSPGRGAPLEPEAAAKPLSQHVDPSASQLAPQGQRMIMSAPMAWEDPSETAAAAKLPHRSVGTMASVVAPKEGILGNDVFSRYTRQNRRSISSCTDGSAEETPPGCQPGVRLESQPGSPAAMRAVEAADDTAAGCIEASMRGASHCAALVHQPDGSCQLVVLKNGAVVAASCDADAPPLLELWEGDSFDREVIAFIRGDDDRLAASVIPTDSAIVAATLAADVAFRDALLQRAAQDSARNMDMVEADRRLAALLVSQDYQNASRSNITSRTCS